VIINGDKQLLTSIIYLYILDELEDVTEELPKRRRLGPPVRTPQPSRGTKSTTQTKTSPPTRSESQQKSTTDSAVNITKKDTEQASVSDYLNF